MKPKTILLVEDNPDEEELALRALRKSGVNTGVKVVRDGQEALDYLFCEGLYQGRDISNIPEVIFLDIKLPKLNGLEVLRKIRADQRSQLIPVVLLTSSDEESDMVAGYSCGANSYIKKPFDFNEFVEQIKVLGKYWLGINRTPQAQH